MSGTASDATIKVFISSRPPLEVVSFQGDLNKGALKTLEKYAVELERSGNRFFALNFQGVTKIDDTVVPLLVKLQMALRNKGAIRLCLLAPSWRQFLLERGSIRESELMDDLAEGLVTLKGLADKAASEASRQG